MGEELGVFGMGMVGIGCTFVSTSVIAARAKTCGSVESMPVFLVSAALAEVCCTDAFGAAVPLVPPFLRRNQDGN